MQLDNQISMGIVKAQKFSNDIQTQQGQIEKTKADILQAQKDLDTRKKIYSARLKNYQLQGQQPIITYAEVLLSSKNLSEFFTRSTAISQILQSDSDIMTVLNEKQQALQNAEQKLHNELDNLKKSQEELVSEQKQIEANKQEVDQALANSQNTLQQQKSQQTQQQSQLQSQQAQLAQQQALQAEQIRQAQLLAQHQAEQARQAQLARQTQQAQQQSSVSNTSSPSANVPSANGSGFSASAVIAYAEQFLGIPYVWGGADPSGFDCSGLMQYVFVHSVGIHLPRVAQDQQNVGTRISPYDVQPGDLVFMGSPAYHVGLYIGGEKWIEAPETGDVVKIANYNPAHFTSASRVLR
jgi:peptidoglycan DL-endopeptidase CwlO